jgi:hypothetical protein
MGASPSLDHGGVFGVGGAYRCGHAGGESGGRGAVGGHRAVVSLSAVAAVRKPKSGAIDTEEAVAAEVAAALRISQALAASRLRYVRALHENLPQVGAVFQAGHIDCRTFQTIVYRSELITDSDVLAGGDAQLAANVGRWRR